jgi:hypothetical protein
LLGRKTSFKALAFEVSFPFLTFRFATLPGLAVKVPIRAGIMNTPETVLGRFREAVVRMTIAIGKGHAEDLLFSDGATITVGLVTDGTGMLRTGEQELSHG